MERRRSVGWEIASWSLVVLAAGYGVMALVEFGLVESAYQTLAGGVLLDLDRLVAVSRIADYVFLAVLVALAVALLVWSRVSAHLIRRNGVDDVKLMVRHWTLRVWHVVLVLSFVVSLGTVAPWDGTRDGLLGALRFLELRYVLRAVAAAFLLVGVVLVSRRLRRFFADPTRPVWVEPASAPPRFGRERPISAEEDMWGWEPPARGAAYADEVKPKRRY
jgi:hypothetical protein